LNDTAVVAAIGCYPQVAPDELHAMPEVDLVVDSINKMTVVDEILDRVGTVHQAYDADPDSDSGDRTRRMVKIQEGCRAHCTYCVIPKARGAPRNIDPHRIALEINQAEAEGFREVVLTGTHVGTYKWKCADGTFLRLAGLLEHLLSETTIPRIRVTSVGPHEIDSRFLDILRHPRVMPHLHMALQSGSATVLKRMKRWYNLQQFRRATRLLRESIPEIGLTTDLIVGFPGETDQEFEETMAFVEEIEFSDIHVFPFSPRRDTVAAEMPDHVTHQKKERRSEQLRQLRDMLVERHLDRQIGQDASILLENKTVLDDSGVARRSGLSGNYTRVYVASKADISENQIINAIPTERFRDGLIADISIRDSLKGRVRL
jgi:threonylcarbamoyladenosine tRNA methylthiotransferase MtaB